MSRSQASTPHYSSSKTLVIRPSYSNYVERQSGDGVKMQNDGIFQSTEECEMPLSIKIKTKDIL